MGLHGVSFLKGVFSAHNIVLRAKCKLHMRNKRIKMIFNHFL